MDDYLHEPECLCHLGHPPCSFCVDGPGEEEQEEFVDSNPRIHVHTPEPEPAFVGCPGGAEDNWVEGPDGLVVLRAAVSSRPRADTFTNDGDNRGWNNALDDWQQASHEQLRSLVRRSVLAWPFCPHGNRPVFLTFNHEVVDNDYVYMARWHCPHCTIRRQRAERS